MTPSPDPALERRPEAAAAPDNTSYELTLFVSGASELSARAILNARQLCDVHIAGPCRLAVVDVHEDPNAALVSGVVATPTLVRSSPLPLRRVVGDLADVDKVLVALDLSSDNAAARDSTPR